MIIIGKTHRDIVAALEPEALDTWVKYLKTVFEITEIEDATEERKFIEELLDADTDVGPFSFGGRAFFLETAEDVVNMIEEEEMGDLFEAPSEFEIKFDMAMYLKADESIAAIMTCSNDAGGNVYFVDKTVLDAVPTIREHIEYTNA